MEWNVLGHEWAAVFLQQQIKRDEVRHAYLFSGPAGVGKRTLALRFAQALNCLQPPAPGLPCGHCRLCQQIERMQQADLSILQAETEGGVLKVDQVRLLQHTLSLTPYEAHYRVALLLRFHEANQNAQNALLKTLEEAPPRVILLLTALSSESVLPTISSRCEIIRLHPMHLAQLQEALQSRWGLKPAEARLLAHISGGRPGYALRLYENPVFLEKRRTWLADAQQMLPANRRQRFHYAERLSKDKETFRQVLQIWLSFWRDVLLCAAAAHLPLTNLDYEDAIRGLASQVDSETARACVAGLEQAVLRLDANINPRLLAEVLLLDWPTFKP